jgi:hypothetical protein
MKTMKVIQLFPDELRDLMKEVVLETLAEVRDQEISYKKYITRDEAAEILRASRETISNYVKRGWLINHGKGRQHLFLKEEVISAQQTINKNKWER